MAAYDPAHVQDLKERTDYELWVLEDFRETVFAQNELPDGRWEFTVGDRGLDGNQRGKIVLNFVDHIGDGRAKDKLNRFRPLAFVSAFKIHDMIVEWILGANMAAVPWRFQQKLAALAALGHGAPPILPRFFVVRPVIWHTFVELFASLTPVRNTVVHSANMELLPDGTMRVTPEGRPVVVIDTETQAAYVRFSCILLKCLLEEIAHDRYGIALIESDLERIRAFHGHRFAAVPIRMADVEVTIPAGHVGQNAPYPFEVDFTSIHEETEKICPPQAGGLVVMKLELIAETPVGRLHWLFSPDEIPAGRVPFDVNSAPGNRIAVP